MFTAGAFHRFFVGCFLVASAACSSESDPALGVVESHIDPPPPTYSKIFLDAVSGTAPGNPVTVNHPNGPCLSTAQCFIAPPNPPAGAKPVDNYKLDVYERPAGRGTTASTYLPGIDIVSTEVGLTDDWVYYRINLNGSPTGTSYAFEMNYDNDPRGDAFIHLISPLTGVGTSWGVVGLSVTDDQNNTQGGTFPTEAEGPGNGASYEHNQFNAGSNASGVGGADAAQARIVNGSSIEFAIKRPFLDVLQGSITKAAFRPYASQELIRSGDLYIHDRDNRRGTGSPYPWLQGAGPASCPGGSNGDNGTPAADIAALDSGTRTQTAFQNPCYALPGTYNFDNSGTVVDFANKTDGDFTFIADLELEKTASPATEVTVGGQLQYQLTVTNVSPTPGSATSVTITDPLPAGVTFVSALGCTFASGIVTCVVGTLANQGGTASFTITVTAPNVVGQISNTATLTSSSTDPITDTAVTTVVAPAPTCPDGTRNAGEGCDDGNSNGSDVCSLECKINNFNPCNQMMPGLIGDASCVSTVCDTTGQALPGRCEPANRCGNGRVELVSTNEVCDDGNQVDGDGCEFTGVGACKLSNGQTCTQSPINGFVGDAQCASNICDLGVCSAPLTCGNGRLEAGEGCDDSGTMAGDGCNSACKIEDNNPCNYNPLGLVHNESCAGMFCDETNGVPGSSGTCTTNLVPMITGTPGSATEDILFTFDANVTDPGGPGQTWSIVTTGATPDTCVNSSIVATTGVYTFTSVGPVPPASCRLSIQVCDGGSPNLCATLATTITIIPVNDAPTIDSTAPNSVNEGSTYTYDASILDPDGTGQLWTHTANHTCGGTIGMGTGLVTFTPATPAPPTTCVVEIQVCDSGNLCAIQNRIVSINATNDAPTFTTTGGTSATEDMPYTYDANASDPDGVGQFWSLVSGTCGGSIVSTTGVFTFTPAGPVPPASCVFTLQVCDTGNACATQTTTVTITAVNDAPVINSTAPLLASEGSLYTYSATRNDLDGPGQLWSLIAGNTCGGLINTATGVFTFTPAGPTPPPTCVVAIQVCDQGNPNLCGSQTTTITIGPTNSAPQITSTAPTTATEDVIYSYMATASDPDGVGETWTLAGTHTCGGAFVTGTSLFRFLPTGPVPPATCIVSIRVCDNGGLCDTQSTVVTITPVNDAPIITSTVPPTSVPTGPYVYNATRSDADGPTQIWSLLAAHTCGGSIVASTGAFTFTPTASTVVCVVSIQVCDGGTPNLCAQQTATVTQLLACGNGTPDLGEVCDDGNQINGDGCDTNCRLSNGEDCTDDNQCAS